MPFRFSLWFFFYLAFSILPVTITFSHRVPAGLLNGSSAAAIQGGGDIRIYYQAVDSSLHEWRSYAPNNESYVDTFLVSGNKARADSPLAAIVESPSNLGERSFYYISPDNYLRGYCWEAEDDSWNDCSLNNYKFSVRPGTRYLYAVALSKGSVRVGYQCISGSICEASLRDGEWHTREI